MAENISKLRMALRSGLFGLMSAIFFALFYVFYNFENSGLGALAMAFCWLMFAVLLLYAAIKPKNNKVREYLEMLLSPLSLFS